MEASSDRVHAYEQPISRFGDSVFKSQVLLCGAVALTLCITVGFQDKDLREGPAFFLGLTAVLWITILSEIVPWSSFPVSWQISVPLLDIAAIAMLRLAEPQSGFG